MAEGGLSYGIAVLARFDPRLTLATLASVRAFTPQPDRIVLVVPQTREHIFAGLATGEDLGTDRVIAGDDEMLSAAIHTLAPSTDIGVVVPEGIIFEADYLQALRRKVEDFEDIVGAIDLVHQVIKIDTGPGNDKAEIDLRGRPREASIVSTLRAMLAARSLLGAVFWVRIATLGQIKLAAMPDLGETIAYAQALDELRARGRTEIRFTPSARHLRLIPERRSGYDAGYQLYRCLCQVAEAQHAESALRGALPAHLPPQAERARLIFTQAVRALASPANRHHATTFLKGAFAARRDARNIDRTVQRDLRDMR
ncbi:MAG: hypothetical protein R3D62_04630 [Xanthobacteraceae bacterium]